jgi:hypothetical protein
VTVIKFLVLLGVKITSILFYRYRVFKQGSGEKLVADDFRNLRVLVFLHHTSLFEPLFIGIVPIRFLWGLAARGVFPAADITMNRPILGKFITLLSKEAVSITRKRDWTWDKFMAGCSPDAIIIILPEGRMMRKTGLDKYGQPMTVKGGVADVLDKVSSGKMMVATSGGLHHIQAPGEGFPRPFKTIKGLVEMMDIAEYKEMLRPWSDLAEFRRAVRDDLQRRMEQNVAELSGGDKGGDQGGDQGGDFV